MASGFQEKKSLPSSFFCDDAEKTKYPKIPNADLQDYLINSIIGYSGYYYKISDLKANIEGLDDKGKQEYKKTMITAFDKLKKSIEKNVDIFDTDAESKKLIETYRIPIVYLNANVPDEVKGKGKPIKKIGGSGSDFESWKSQYINPINQNLKHLIENKKNGKLPPTANFLKSVINMINSFLSTKLSVHSLSSNMNGFKQRININGSDYLAYVIKQLKNVSEFNTNTIKLINLKKLLLNLVASHNLDNQEIKMITKYARKL
jgi:hypothetical protein